MKKILLVLFFHVAIIHFLVRAILLEFLSGNRHVNARRKNEADYFEWEQWQMFFVYFLPFMSLPVGEIFGFWVTFCFSIFVAILRSIEHVDRSIIK